MRAGDLLRQLDQRLLPPLTRAVARLADGSTRPRLLSSTALLSVAAVLLTAVWATSRDRSVGDPTVGEVTRVGVVDGDSVPGYLRAAAADLAALPSAEPRGGTYALVSLDTYLPPQRLTAVLGDVSVSEVFGRVPLPGRQTEIVRIPALRVPDDVTAGMAELAARKDREAADYRARAAESVGDSDLRQVYASNAEVAAAEADAYRSGCACLYAAVVRAEPTALRVVAERGEVRAVDPAPEVRRLDRTVFTPPLPEQRDVVRPPADTALPEPAPSRSGGTPSAPVPVRTTDVPSAPAPATTVPTTAPEPPSSPSAPPPSPAVTSENAPAEGSAESTTS